ncbi:MAG: hypothetical protein RH860_05000 [Cytophagales bacterium]
MSNKHLIIIGVLLSSVLLTSFLFNTTNENVNVAISATSKGAMQSGVGIVITVKNLESQKSWRSKSLGLMSQHSLIENLPPGKYMISKIEVPLGDFSYINKSKEMTDYFGIMEFENGKTYYLGNFKGQRKVGRSNVFQMKIEDQSIPVKLIKKLSRKGLVSNGKEIIKTYPYESDALMIY